MTKRALLLLTAGLTAAGLVGCGSTQAVEIDTETVIGPRLESLGIAVDRDSLTCSGESLSADEKASVRCDFTAGGQPVGLVAGVKSIDGATVEVDIVTVAKAVPKAVLAKSVAARIGEGEGLRVTSSVCAGDLQPEVGQSTTCDLASGGEKATLRVTVASIDGGLINYTVDKA